MNYIILVETLVSSLFLIACIAYFFGVQPVYAYCNKEDGSFWDYSLFVAVIINGLWAIAAVGSYLVGWGVEDPTDSIAAFSFAFHIFTLVGFTFAVLCLGISKIFKYLGSIHSRIIKRRGL